MTTCCIRQMTRREQLQELEAELSETELRVAIKRRLDDIDNIASAMSYQNHRAVQCLLGEVVDIVCISQGTLSAEAASPVESVRVTRMR